MKLINEHINIIKFITTILLYFFGSYIQYIPILLFNIDIKTCSSTTLYALQIFYYLFLIISLSLLYRKDLKKDFKNFIKKFEENTDIAIKYWLIGLIIMGVSNFLISQFSPVKIANNEQMVRDTINKIPVMAFFFTTLFAPYIEEITFRKAFRKVINDKTTYILVSGIIFGSMHVLMSVKTVYDYLYIIPYSALGLSFSYIYAKTENVFPSMFVHAVHNGTITILTILRAMIIL